MQFKANIKFILISMLASSIFATIAPFAVAAQNAGLVPSYSVLYRYFVLVGLATPIVFIYFRDHFNFTKTQLWLVILQGIAGCFLNLAYLGALSYIPLSLAVIIFFTFPIITLLVTPFVFGGQLTWYKLLVFLVAFIGLALVVGPKFTDLDPLGMLLAFLGAVFAVTQLLCMNKLVREVSLPALLYSVHFISMILAIITIGILYSLGYLVAPPALTMDMALGFSGIVIGYIIAYGLFAYVSGVLQPTTISLFSNIEPLITIAIAVLLFSEVLQVEQVVGIAVVLAALVAGSLAKS